MHSFPAKNKVFSWYGPLLSALHSRLFFYCQTTPCPDCRTEKGDQRLLWPMEGYSLTPQDWTPACEEAFESLNTVLLNSVVLVHPDFEKPFILSTNASLNGLGVVLSQVSAAEEKVRPITFASKSLTSSQANYPAHRLEFLALKWTVSDKFSH